MKKTIFILALAMLMLAGCSVKKTTTAPSTEPALLLKDPEPPQTVPVTNPTIPTTVPTQPPVTEPATVPTTAPTEPPAIVITKHLREEIEVDRLELRCREFGKILVVGTDIASA